MSKIFELFGYRLDSWNDKANANRAKAWCPFMGAVCDGGGNRYLSAIDLKKNVSLQGYFPNKTIVQAGVCSLRLKENEQPWIVCPRRLLSLRRGDGPDYQSYVKQSLKKYAGLTGRQSNRAWAEVKMKVETLTEDDRSKSFDYSFDYILAGSERVTVAKAAKLLGIGERRVRKIAQDNGFTLAQRGGEFWIDDFPADPVVIVEIMTSSTSGGDKKKRTQIAMAFEDAVKSGTKHQAPSINYRQVWARMVSQLIVKSQVGLAWGGKTVWLLQDVLADYISASTALDLSRYLGERADEVNILAFGYGDIDHAPDKNGVVEIKKAQFFSGPISEGGDKGSSGFVDIVKIGAPPPKEHLWRALFLKAPVGSLSA